MATNEQLGTGKRTQHLNEASIFRTDGTKRPMSHGLSFTVEFNQEVDCVKPKSFENHMEFNEKPIPE